MIGRTMARILAALGLALFAGLLYLDFIHVPVRTFATFDEMERSTLRRQLWYYPYAPETATHIREAHDSESKAQWLAFRAPPDAIRKMSRQLPPTPPESPHRVPWRLSWWPRALDPKPQPSGESRFNFFLNGDHIYAIDSIAGEVFAWRNGS